MTGSVVRVAAALFLAAGPISAQTAIDVVDRGSLRAFVERAADLAERRTDTASAQVFFHRTFRPEGEWRRGEIYLFIVTVDATVVFHATNPALEGRDDSQVTDKNGVRFVVELIEAAQAGGGFVEYHVPLEGHPREGELKVAYATPLELDGADWVIASGYHPTPVSALPFMESLRRWLASVSRGSGRDSTARAITPSPGGCRRNRSSRPAFPTTAGMRRPAQFSLMQLCCPPTSEAWLDALDPVLHQEHSRSRGRWIRPYRSSTPRATTTRRRST